MTVATDRLAFKDRDEFNRELVAEKAIKLLTSDIDISPMVIDGDWGTGKTEFCHKLISKFREEHENVSILYVDAFQADHADNPLMTLLAAVLTLLPQDEVKESFLRKAIPVARYGLATVGKATIGHLLKQNAESLAEGLEEHLQDAADKAIDASVKALLKDHEQAEANLKALQTALASIANDKQIIIFIDELDRCRPDFSVQMLEVIKHTFNVQKVKFVLITNLKQLKAAINHCYGSLVDSQRYLDKFLKFSFRLPEFVVNQSHHVLGQKLAAVEHFSNRVKASTVLSETDLANSSQSVSSFTKLLIERNNLSLREVETFIRNLEIYQKLSRGLNEDDFGYHLLRIFGVFIVFFTPDLAFSVRKNEVDARQITNPLGDYDWTMDSTELQLKSHVDFVAVMLAIDSKSNNPKYKFNDEFLQSFNERISGFFGIWGFDGDSKFEVIKEVIQTLDLGSS